MCCSGYRCMPIGDSVSDGDGEGDGDDAYSCG
jgi:hypothetical protein